MFHAAVDNAVAELFLAAYNKELIYTRPRNYLTEVRQHIPEATTTLTLDYLTPIEYELGFKKLTDLAA